MNEAWAKLVIESMSDGVLLLGPDLTVRALNPAAEQLLGVTAERLVGRALGRELPVIGAREMAALAGVIETGTRCELHDVVLPTPGLDARRFDANLDPCADGGAVILLRDTTARAQLEERSRAVAEQARAAASAAASANRAKSDFLAAMSHEFRTPLNAIVGYAELLELQLAGPLTAPQREYLARLQASARHLLGLLTDVLDLTRADAGRLRIQREPARAGDVVEAAVQLIRPEATARRIVVRDELDTAARNVVYLGDEQRVRQVLLNLLSNAVKFTQPGGRVTLRGSASPPGAGPPSAGDDGGPWVGFEVSDTGIGIAPGQLADVFEPFVQVEAGLTRATGGTGLGLTLSRRIARLMGGDLTADSRVGQGSTFTLWLPAAAAEGAVNVAADEYRHEHGGAGPVRDRLREAGEALAERANEVVHGYAQRLRDIPIVPQARDLVQTDLEDHAPSFVADLAQSLKIIESGGAEPSAILRDGSDVQRLIAERHGAQRYRLGWTEDALRQEYEVMREELAAAVRAAPRDPRDADGALEILTRLVEYAEQVSVRGFRQAGAEAAA